MDKAQLTLTLLALSDANVGHLISAIPPTLAVLVSLFVLRAGQKRNAVALDGKLEQLMAAEKGVARAEGAAQERSEERGRNDGTPQPVIVENTPESPAIVKAVEHAAPQKTKRKRSKGAQKEAH